MEVNINSQWKMIKSNVLSSLVLELVQFVFKITCNSIRDQHLQRSCSSFILILPELDKQMQRFVHKIMDVLSEGQEHFDGDDDGDDGDDWVWHPLH